MKLIKYLAKFIKIGKQNDTLVWITYDKAAGYTTQENWLNPQPETRLSQENLTEIVSIHSKTFLELLLNTSWWQMKVCVDHLLQRSEYKRKTITLYNMVGLHEGTPTSKKSSIVIH
jgi:hypothetical protein